MFDAESGFRAMGTSHLGQACPHKPATLYKPGSVEIFGLPCLHVFSDKARGRDPGIIIAALRGNAGYLDKVQDSPQSWQRDKNWEMVIPSKYPNNERKTVGEIVLQVIMT